MDKKKFYLFSFSSLVGVLILYWILIFSNLIQLPLKLSLLLTFSLLFLFIVAAFIATFGEYKTADSFLPRFFILTTFQMIGFLSIVAAVRVSAKEFVFPFALHIMIPFFILLIIQTILLVKIMQSIPTKETKKEEEK